ncbi:MAG: hypothetical protein JWM93_2025 [Frankiales bacterium]|nr:hypothetical protein [Frankiales bacterium]
MSLVLNGTSGVSLGSPAALNTATTTDACLVVAFKFNSSGGCVIYGEGSTGAKGDWCVYYNAGTLGVLMYTASGVANYPAIVTLSDLTDYVVCVRRTGTVFPVGIDIFVNGTKYANPGQANIADNGENFAAIGYDTYGNGTTPQEFMTGTIYQVAKFSTAPNDAALAAMTAATKLDNWSTLGTVLGYWQLISSAADSGPNGITGTSVGSPTYTGSGAPPAGTPPTANAGADTAGVSGATVSLGGTDTAGSSAITSRAWSQVSPPSPTGAFSAPTAATTNWTLPTVTSSTAFVLRKTVSDGTLSDTDDVTVTVAPVAAGTGGALLVSKSGTWV